MDVQHEEKQLHATVLLNGAGNLPINYVDLRKFSFPSKQRTHLLSAVNIMYIPFLVLSSIIFYARCIVCPSTVCLCGVLFRIMF